LIARPAMRFLRLIDDGGDRRQSPEDLRQGRKLRLRQGRRRGSAG